MARSCPAYVLLFVLLAMSHPGFAQSRSLNDVADQYIKLALALGQHDPDYVDAYYGPEAWRAEVKQQNLSLEAIGALASKLIDGLKRIDVSHEEELVRLRHRFLVKQLEALAERARILRGAKLSFDEETKSLYDAIAPRYSEKHFQAVLAELEQKVPAGEGNLAERLERFRRQFIVPREKLPALFNIALREARRRTKEHIDLPDGEQVTIEYVNGKPWGAYAWYKGDYHTLVQVNTDLPVHVDHVVDLACHEGYPGHHVNYTLQEEHLVRDRGWREFSVFVLFSPQSLLAEGTAEAGIELAFPKDQRLAFERDVLFPAAGLDPGQAALYQEVRALTEKLSYARNEVARRLLAGEINEQQAVDWLGKYTLNPSDRARKAVAFIQRYRGYVINYNWGKDLVRGHLDRCCGAAGAERRWMEYEKLLSRPCLPSDLK